MELHLILVLTRDRIHETAKVESGPCESCPAAMTLAAPEVLASSAGGAHGPETAATHRQKFLDTASDTNVASS